MKFKATPGKDDTTAAFNRAMKHSQPPGKTDGPVRPKANPKALAPATSKRATRDPRKKQKTYPGTKKMNYGA
jgi:hypothetical protein